MLDNLSENITTEGRLENLPFKKGSEFVEDDEKVEATEKKLLGFNSFFKEVPDTALPAVRLHLFEFFLHNPEADPLDIQNELEKMKILIKKEKSSKKLKDSLPTIGIELEASDSAISENLKEFCKKNNLKSGYDVGRIYEFRPSFSYSAAVQARILHDLEKLIKFEEFGGEPNYYAYAPLHINVGIPEELNTCNEFKLNKEYLIFAKLITSSFVSAERIEAGEWSNAYNSKPLERDEKTTKSQRMRLEIRTPSFEEQSDYIMIFGVQVLSGAMFAYLKKTEGECFGKKCILLSTLWEELKIDYKKIEDKYNIELVDLNSIDVALSKIKKENINFEVDCRKLFDKYATEARQIINEK